jgi:tetratricopeptide (TPR) repeat protein
MPLRAYAACSDTSKEAGVTNSTSVKAFPRLAEAQELFKQGLKDEASMKVIEHLRENRDDPRGLALLGEIALDSGALVQSEQFLRQAIARGARAFEVQRNLASVILQQDRLDEALEAFTVLDQRFNEVSLTSTRAMIVDRLGRTEESLKLHERVIADPKAEPQHWILYGHSLRFAGRTDEAIDAYRHVVADDPERGEAWWSLADIKSRILTDQDMQVMEEALSLAVDVLNVAPLHMALGRGWHDRGEYERAFRHYEEGNRLRAQAFRYDPNQLTREIDQFIEMAESLQFTAPLDMAGPVPIFLISLPRSGSTLLEQMLGRHPQIEAVGELPYIQSMLRSMFELHLRREPISVPALVQRLSPQQMRGLAQDYLERASLHRHSDAPYFIDKLPTNWTNILLIRQILPQARFIEIRRNPMDCCFSNFSHYFGSAHASSFDLVHMARSCVDYWRFMDHLAQTGPGSMCSIRYEDLIDDPEPALRNVLDYLGLEWDDSLLRFYESSRTVRTPSAEQVRRPLNRKGLDTWKPYAQWLGPLRDALGPLADA